MTDMVEHPPHYQTDSGLEAIDVIGSFFRENYNLGTVFKYIARAGKKWDAVEDLKKARWYLDKEIEWREEAGDDSVEIQTYTLYPDDKDPEIGDQVYITTGSFVYGNGLLGVVEKVDAPHMPYRYFVRFEDGNLVPYDKNEMKYRID